jgi:hypothetical protein
MRLCCFSPSSHEHALLPSLQVHEPPTNLAAGLTRSLTQAVSTDLGGAIANLSVAIAPWMAPVAPAAAVPVRDPADVVDLRTTPIVELLGYATKMGIGPEGLNALVNSVLPSGAAHRANISNVNRTVSVGSHHNATAVVGVTSFTFRVLTRSKPCLPSTLLDRTRFVQSSELRGWS